MDVLAQVLFAIRELNDDSQTPKHVREKLSSAIKVLSDGSDMKIKLHRALNELENLADDSSVQSYTRTQIFNIVSLLESA